MNINIEVRKKQLESLDQYISSSKDRVDSVLAYFGWNAKKVSEVAEKTVCPFNKGHTVPLEKVVKHVDTCRLLSAGYTLEEQFLSEPLHHPKSSIIIDEPKKVEILNNARIGNTKFKQVWNGHDPDPLTADRIVTTYSADERVALYNYSIKNTEGPPVPPEFDININDSDKKEEKELTYEEKLEKERNVKRRRVKYRSVHTGRNKSYTEVMREVIDNQMELYQEYLANQTRIKEEELKQYCDNPENSTIVDSSSQQYVYTGEYSQPQTEALQEIQYYDDQYEKYIPTDYFSNIQKPHTYTEPNQMYNTQVQTTDGQADFSNYYNGAIYENLDKLTASSSHSVHSGKSGGKQYSEKCYPEIDKSYENEKYSAERKESYKNCREKPREKYDKDYRSHRDYDRKSDRSRERSRDLHNGESRYSSRDAYKDDRRYSHDSKSGSSRNSKGSPRYKRRRH